MHNLLKTRHSAILLPLFSMGSKDDFGCGDISSLNEWIDFIKETGFNIIQILPLNEMPPHNNCPYTSLTAFAVDPVYISIKDIEELSPHLIKKIKSKEFKQLITGIKKKDYIDYDEIKKIKFEILWEQYNFFQKNFSNSSKLKIAFEEYKLKHNWWLYDYAIFRRLKDLYNWRSWREWDDNFKNFKKDALDKFNREDLFNIDFFRYIQWEIDKQFKKIREKLDKNKIMLLGDLPFMVNQESVDVWSRQEEFNLELEVGAPPDEFSKDGQRWGLPAPLWDRQMENNFEWWRLKIKRFEELYDIFRIDHMVGFFRTWVIPRNNLKQANFDILDPLKQQERGRKFLNTITASTKMLAIAEDLGVIPDYVREVLKELNVCGYKVMRWEKEKDGSYIPPLRYYPISVATTSTHDTEPMKKWYEGLDKNEKMKFIEMLYDLKQKKIFKNYKEIKYMVNKRLLEASSVIAILTISDIIGTEDRINTPNTTGKHNWSWKIKTGWERFYEKHRSDFEILKNDILKRKNEKVDLN